VLQPENQVLNQIAHAQMENTNKPIKLVLHVHTNVKHVSENPIIVQAVKLEELLNTYVNAQMVN
jgi:hypothetical protein